MAYVDFVRADGVNVSVNADDASAVVGVPGDAGSSWVYGSTMADLKVQGGPVATLTALGGPTGWAPFVSADDPTQILAVRASATQQVVEVDASSCSVVLAPGTDKRIRVVGTFAAVTTALDNALPNLVPGAGTYIPALGNEVNIAASTPSSWMYIEVDDGSQHVVTVAGRILMTPTAPGAMSCEVTIPVGSIFSSFSDGSGLVSGSSGGVGAEGQMGSVPATSQMALTVYNATVAAEYVFDVSFSYVVLV